MIHRLAVLAPLGLLFAVAVLAALTASGSAQESREAVRVLARVDVDLITDLEVARYMGRKIPSTGETPHPVVEQALVEMIITRLEVREARARGVKVAPEAIEAALGRQVLRLGGPERFGALLEDSPTTIADIRQSLDDALLVRRLYLTTASGPLVPGKEPLRGRVRPADAREHYRTHRERYRRAGKARVSLIEIRARAGDEMDPETRLQAVLARLGAGAEFADVARTESSGPRADTGGDLGWLEKGHLDTRVDDFVFAAEKGALSEPIPTPRGSWWIIKVTDTAPGEQLTFEEVQDRIADEIHAERLVALRRTVVRGLVERALIWPERLRRQVIERIDSLPEPVQP